MPYNAFSAARTPPRRLMAPERLLRAASGWFVALTLFVAWLLNLLPWGRWPGVPDFFAICLLFWALQAPDRVGMVVAFVGGILLDVHNAALLGEHALAYTLMVYWVGVLRGRILRFGLVGQTLHVFPIILFSVAIMVVLRSWVLGYWPGWWWVADSLVSAVLWPLGAWLLQLPQRLEAGGDPA